MRLRRQAMRLLGYEAKEAGYEAGYEAKEAG